MSIGLIKPVKGARLNQGSSLLETMISLFILAIGLLGVISMQAIGLKGNQRSTFSSEALFLASDMADQIYAFNDVDIDTDDNAFANFTTVGQSTTGYANCTSDVKCELDDQVDYVKSMWAKAFNERLPSGVGEVAFDVAESIYTITVKWNANKTEPTGEDCSDEENSLSCYVMEIAL